MASFNVIDLFVFIIRRWWKMLIALGVFAVIGVGLAFLLPKRYKAEIKLLPPPQESGLMGALSGLQSQLGITGLSIPGAGGGEILYYGEILRSQTILDNVIDECSLLVRLDVENRAQARAELSGATAHKLLSLEQVFIIEVVGPDNVLVADIANSYARSLDHYLKHSSNTRGRHLREFVEGRLSQVEADMKAAQDSLEAFQRKHRLPAVNTETGGDMQAFAELKAQAIQKELELEYMRSFSTANNPQYEATRRELAIIQNKLASLPPLASRYLDLSRNFMVQQEIYILLVQQYEQAKLMEAKDTPLLSILEWVQPPEEPFFPPKKLVVIAVLLVGLVLIVAYALISVYWENVVSHPEAHEKIARLRSEVKKSFGRRKR